MDDADQIILDDNALDDIDLFPGANKTIDDLLNDYYFLSCEAFVERYNIAFFKRLERNQG
jgi:hypothetical protein